MQNVFINKCMNYSNQPPGDINQLHCMHAKFAFLLMGQGIIVLLINHQMCCGDCDWAIHLQCLTSKLRMYVVLPFPVSTKEVMREKSA